MYGRTLLSNSTVNPTRVSADNQPILKPGGVTIDWENTVTALVADATNPDGSVIKSGLKYLRYGQVLCKITGTDNTVTLTNATGGTFTLTVSTSSPVAGSPSQTTGTIAYNASAATVQTALRALTNVGAFVSVSGSAGGPYTLTFDSLLGSVVVTINAASLTPTGTNVVSTAIGANLSSGTTNGLFGPYDSAASDGRQTLTRGECFILDETVLQYGIAGSTLMPANDQIGGCIEGGRVWLNRILQAGAGTHSLAAGPTKSELLTAFPAIQLVEN